MCPGPASKALGGSSFPRIRRCLKFSLTSVLGVCYFVSRSSALLETCLLPISKPEVSKRHMDKQPSAFTQQGYNTAVHFLLLPLGEPSISDSSAQPHPSTQTTTQPSTYPAVPPPISPSLHPSHHQSPHAVTLQSHLGSGSGGCLPWAHIQPRSLSLADSFCITSLRYGLPYPSVQLKLLSRLSAFHISITVKSFSLLGKCSLIQRSLLHLPAQPLPYPPTTA